MDDRFLSIVLCKLNGGPVRQSILDTFQYNRRNRSIYFAVAGGATTETEALGSIPGIGKCAEIANRFRIKPICSDTAARYV